MVTKCGVGTDNPEARQSATGQIRGVGSAVPYLPSLPGHGLSVRAGARAGLQLIAWNACERAVRRPSESCDRLGGSNGGRNTAA